MLNSVATYNEAFNIVSSLSLIDFIKIKKELPAIEISIKKKNRVNNQTITSCPKCGFNHIKKNGHAKNGHQKYVCLSPECRNNFCSTTNTILFKSKKLKDKMPLLIESFLQRDTIRVAKAKLDVSLATSLIWRSKLAACTQAFFTDKLNGMIEFDETYIPFNFKGTKTKNMPRTSKKRGGKTVSKRELIIVGMAIDDNDRIAASVLGNGFYKTQSVRMQKQFGDKLEKGSAFITDSEISLSLFSKNNALNHVKIPSGHHATFDGKYNINTINGIHSEFKLFLKPFRGISTRHIATYVDWFKTMKYLQYHYDPQEKLYVLHKLLTEKRIIQKIGFKNYYKIPYIVQVYRTYKEQKLIYWKNVEKYGWN